MSNHRNDAGANGSHHRSASDGWGGVPEADRPLWSRYMLDHCPWFPGATIMTFIADGIINGGTRAPQVWKETAQELHGAGFTPLRYFLLAELLSGARKKGELVQEAQGHLFKQWYQEPFPAFQLEAQAWKPWLERLQQAQSPIRALSHMLHGAKRAPLGVLTGDVGQSGDGRLVVAGRVRPVVVVLVEPVSECVATLLLTGVAASVSPSVGHCAMEAFDLAVGLRPVGAGPLRGDGQLLAGVAPQVRAVGTAIV